ncbi:hypothetical protein R3W88_000665 [Solanum pinnatisectum]|uniref:F-box associated beta-propeller type 3 domain-containing protein n=1 Tax=Solanum pinnatisectum TaxID=50273 RepID=A0AAV9MGK5_9SOLN|nr:hypothetical protein R3W88_000665 [Solanum pinnatisectum]
MAEQNSYCAKENQFLTLLSKEKEKTAPFSQIARFNDLYLHGLSYCPLNCVNGLFCVWDPFSTRPAAIFNLSTRELRFLPNIDEEYFPGTYSLGFELEEKKFKVFLTSYHERNKQRLWVLTLGIDKSWRETKNISFAISYFKYSVCISGVIYQFIDGAIAAVDVKSENCILIEVKGKLAIIDCEKWVSGYFDLWILEKTPKREWERHIIGVPSIWNTTEPRFASFFDGEIVFVVNSGDLCCLCYDFTRKSWSELKIKGPPKGNDIKGIYSYVESLVPFG